MESIVNSKKCEKIKAAKANQQDQDNAQEPENIIQKLTKAFDKVIYSCSEFLEEEKKKTEEGQNLKTSIISIATTGSLFKESSKFFFPPTIGTTEYKKMTHTDIGSSVLISESQLSDSNHKLSKKSDNKSSLSNEKSV